MAELLLQGLHKAPPSTQLIDVIALFILIYAHAWQNEKYCATIILRSLGQN